MIQNMKNHSWEKTTIVRNDYGENIEIYVPNGEVKIFISFVDINQGVQNQVLFDDYTHIGLTRENGIEKTDKIGGRYIVKYILESKPFNRVFLEEVQDGTKS